jgi:iron(II)-dependent oxidoreductase
MRATVPIVATGSSVFREPFMPLVNLRAAEVAEHLIAARARVDALTGDLCGAQLLGPKLEIVNPVLWEIGHVAWFQEYWCLRLRQDGTRAPSMLAGADELFDSTAIPHDVRWELPLPELARTRGYLREVLERVLGNLERQADDARMLYFAELAACHEDMHAEAFHYTRQTLAYDAPAIPAAPSAMAAQAGEGGDASFPGGTFLLGARQDGEFVHDNEKWAHEVSVRPFRLARFQVTNREFLAFVEAGGYGRRAHWSEAGWVWRKQRSASSPRYWRKMDGQWHQRRFANWIPLAPDEPVIHVTWYEAEAYCRSVGRRLPTETEWEYAACDGRSSGKLLAPWGGGRPDRLHANLEGNSTAPVSSFAAGDSPRGCRQLLGNVWEWTASTFEPYPGFVPDPYAEYSAPWFGSRKVLRGGSFATPQRLVRNTWRNFFTPERDDVFAGFRTCDLAE